MLSTSCNKYQINISLFDVALRVNSSFSNYSMSEPQKCQMITFICGCEVYFSFFKSFVSPNSVL